MPAAPPLAPDDRYKKGILLLAILLFSWLSGIKGFLLDWTKAADSTQQVSQPNILMLVVDDLGYNDTNAINHNGLDTPTITGLAREGVTFRRHYADSTCTPSRVAMLTGRYPERSGFRPTGIEIPAEFPTIAEQLKRAGYTTYLTGKWHAGEYRDKSWPQNKGFDGWFGFLNQWELAPEETISANGKRRPTYRNPMLRTNGGELEAHKGHLTDILTEHTLLKLEQLRAGKQPWFLYHAFLAPHHPIQPAERYSERFPDTPEGQYTALITQLDDAIARILAAVDKESTLVILVSDNGGTNKQRDNNFPFYGKKGDAYEGAYRTPLILRWPGVIPEGTAIDDIAMNVDIYPTLLAAAHIEPEDGIDGTNLWPLLLNDTASVNRTRTWDVFNPNVNTVSFSMLSGSGQWRLASPQGLEPSLFDLLANPAGDTDIAGTNAEVVDHLTSVFWTEFWNKSRIAALERPGADEQQTLYTGFDAMRTPFQFGFAIGLEIGPLPSPFSTEARYQVLAGQAGVWELRYVPDIGLEWHMGTTVLTDPHFQPSTCNATILTGYFEPLVHLAKREPRSNLKLYSSGMLRDMSRAIEFKALSDEQLGGPTFVNFGGRALFANVMLSSFADSYAPAISSKFLDIYTPLFKEQKLSLAEVSMMSAELCQ